MNVRGQCVGDIKNIKRSKIIVIKILKEHALDGPCASVSNLYVKR